MSYNWLETIEELIDNAISSHEMNAREGWLEVMQMAQSNANRGLPELTPYINNNGFEAAQPDESPEETVFRLIIESPAFEVMDSTEREMFLLGIATPCIQWVRDRTNF